MDTNENWINWTLDLCKKYNVPFDAIDINAELDRTLSWEENKRHIIELLEKLTPDNLALKTQSLTRTQIKDMQIEIENYCDDMIPKEDLEKCRTIAIYGDIGSGKTALAYKVIETLENKRVYFLKHPQPHLIAKFGYKNLRSLEELEDKQDCVIYWDEPQLTTSVYDHHTNSTIAKVCSLARQLNITLIISSSDTRVFTKHNEAYFDLWLIKDIDYNMVKNGSKIKYAIRNNCRFEPQGFKLKINEYIAESRKISGQNGRHKFSLPLIWTEQLSKPYRN